MPVGSVVLAPGTPPFPCDLPTLDLSAEDYDDPDWIARVAIAIGQAGGELAEPVLLVLAGRHAALAPGLGFAQRAARRAIAGYVLVDPVLPSAATHEWPDAPVTVIITSKADDDVRSAALAARLRGWDVVTGDIANALPAILARP
ncbi:MAG: hypothetical protein VW082_10105 [Candidatus Nanopelagicales bacterium]